MLITTKVELAKKPSGSSHTEYGNTSGNRVGVDNPIKAKSGSKNVTSTPLNSKGLSRNQIINLLPQLKKEYEWLKEPASQVLQQAALDL
ncbi:hypothetical protein [Microseira wollei]|uniref:hypothetical protein n=1 Tax=Microseira wollei TaxID=467598 RepID=UPI001CFC4E5F|nr:hypothetical protein [Microseira wollei]